MKPRSRVLLLLLFFFLFHPFSSRTCNLLFTASPCFLRRFLLSLHSVLLRPVSSFSLVPFVISRALFFFFFDLSSQRHLCHLASSLSLLSCLVFPPTVPPLFSFQVRGVSAGARRLIYESHASNPTAPRGTANDMCFSTLGIFSTLSTRIVFLPPFYPAHFCRASLVGQAQSFLFYTVWKIECSAEYQRRLLIVNTINTLRYDAVTYSR